MSELTRRWAALDDVCTCDGCWACKGHEAGCTCDIDWDALYESRHES